jgi:hypothetical protein
LKRFVLRQLGLDGYFKRPGDGRTRPQIPPGQLIWAQLIGTLLREGTFHAIEALVRSPARWALGVARRFGDDALAYFTERLDPAPTRQAVATALRRAKRNKAFENTRFIGLAVDASGGGACQGAHCAYCRPVLNAQHEVIGYLHWFSALTVVAPGLTLPLDVEPYGPGDSEYAASQRLLKRDVALLGRRFADYVIGDSEYATAPFLHLAGELGLHVVARLKGNLPELLEAAEARFGAMPPTATFEVGPDRIEIWDADDFDPWERLRWATVRVVRYRQHRPNGVVIEAYWLTDFPTSQLGSRGFYAIAKSRWQIENQLFNDGKNRYGMEHITHHHQNSLLVGWLLICLALTVERLYRLRYLHRGGRPAYAPIDLVRRFRLSLGAPPVPDTS